MGEHTTSRTIRRLGAAGAALLVAGALTSCSQLLHRTGAPAAAPAAAERPVAVQDSAEATAPVTSAAPDEPEASEPVAVATGDPIDVATPTPSATVHGLGVVTPFITTATATGSAVDVAAIVPTIAESGGTCTVVLTQGDASRTATGHGVLAGTYTGCEAVHLDDVAPGTWQVEVRYASSTAAGTSAPQPVTVG